LVQERAREANRVQKVLETANIKLGDVATDVLGASGRAMLKALIAGERDAETLAGLAQGLLRKKKAQLREALVGRVTDHHTFMLLGLLSPSRGVSWASGLSSAPRRRPMRLGQAHGPARVDGAADRELGLP
jgi:hypothetical protein